MRQCQHSCGDSGRHSPRPPPIGYEFRSRGAQLGVRFGRRGSRCSCFELGTAPGRGEGPQMRVWAAMRDSAALLAGPCARAAPQQGMETNTASRDMHVGAVSQLVDSG